MIVPNVNKPNGELDGEALIGMIIIWCKMMHMLLTAT